LKKKRVTHPFCNDVEIAPRRHSRPDKQEAKKEFGESGQKKHKKTKQNKTKKTDEEREGSKKNTRKSATR